MHKREHLYLKLFEGSGRMRGERTMADVMELLDHIRREQDNFPAAQKKVAAFVVENYQQIAFLPISALSQR